MDPQQLEHALVMMQQQMLLQQQQIALHQQQLAAAAAIPAAAAAAPRPPSIRLSSPAQYDGVASTLEDWVAAMMQQFLFYGVAADADRIRTAVAFLKGPALAWWSTLVAVPTTWATFDAALRARFQPVTTEEIARGRLHSLSQDKSSINDYVSNFRRLIIAIPSMDAASQMFAFVRGLKPALQTHHRQAQPLTLELAIALAVRMGTGIPGQSAASAASHYGASAAMDLSAMRAELDDEDSESTASADGDAPVTRSEFAMLLAAIHRNNGSGSNGRGAQGASGGFHPPRGPPKIYGFSEEKVQEYMDAGQCFGCGSTKHRSRECTKKHTSSKKPGSEN